MLQLVGMGKRLTVALVASCALFAWRIVGPSKCSWEVDNVLFGRSFKPIPYTVSYCVLSSGYAKYRVLFRCTSLRRVRNLEL